MVLIPPGTPHHVLGDPSGAIDVITLHFRSPGLLKRLPELALIMGQLCACDGALAEALGDLCAQAWREQSSPAWRLCHGLGTLLLLLASRASGAKRRGPMLGASQGLLKKLEEQVGSDPGRRMGLAAAADLLGCSVSELTHAASQQSGPTPHAVMLQARLELAKQLLRETRLPIKDIAGRAGFSTQASFGRAFLRLERRPPGEYRRKLALASGQASA
jgi:AraC-like DNA-binding protein